MSLDLDVHHTLGSFTLDARFTACFEREIAFRIESHRAIAEIRGPDAQPFVVGNHHLRMHVDTGALPETRRMRVIDIEAPEPVGGPAHHGVRYWAPMLVSAMFTGARLG